MLETIVTWRQVHVGVTVPESVLDIGLKMSSDIHSPGAAVRLEPCFLNEDCCYALKSRLPLALLRRSRHGRLATGQTSIPFLRCTTVCVDCESITTVCCSQRHVGVVAVLPLRLTVLGLDSTSMKTISLIGTTYLQVLEVSTVAVLTRL